MKRRLQTGFAGLALLAVTIVGRAYGHDPYNDERNGRDGYPYGTGAYSGSLVEQISRDVAMVRSNSRVDGHERDHFNTVQRELADFQRRWKQGRFENGRLDRAISSLSHLVNSDQIDPRRRRILANDLANLRSFRANGWRDNGAYGRDNNGRYGPYGPSNR